MVLLSNGHSTEAILKSVEKLDRVNNFNDGTDESNCKRSAKTPPSALRRQCWSNTIADDIITSVEKLKRFKISSDEVRSNTRKQIHFDHEYVKCLVDNNPKSTTQEPKESNTLDPSLIICADKSIPYYGLLEELDLQLRGLAVNGISVLFTNKDVDSLTSKHVLNAAIHEMLEKCPLLLHVLSRSLSSTTCSLGSETLIASIATVYGMILHSRNNKASAIQKVYSSLAIRYHADNEMQTARGKVVESRAHTQQERFDQLHPIIMELFHTQQDFLDLTSHGLKDQEGMQNVSETWERKGNSNTIAHLKAVIQRVNVNGQVKARFKAHEDFIKLVGCAYFLDFVMGKFGMKDQKDEPCHPIIPENITRVHTGRKSLVASAVIDFILDAILIECDMQDKPDPAQDIVQMKVSIGNNTTEVVSSVVQGQVYIDLLVNDNPSRITIPESSLNEGRTIIVANLPLVIQRIRPVKPPQDELENYATHFLQWYFVIIQMTDAIHEGDVIRTNVILKHMIPFFYSHSVLSKYLVECIDYVMKTEVVLSPEFGMRVRAGSFVNCHGGVGKNKATDMQNENEVKALKELIKGLGSNKTEQSIIAVCKAMPSILDVVSKFDTMVSVGTISTTHKKRSYEEDLDAVLKVVKKAGIWQNASRSLAGFKAISKSPFAFNKPLFKRTVRNIIDRLQRDLPPVPDDDDESGDV
ncbi:uncharacterized protein LOC117318526 [Pecten maximus]|uniref:uncharacterized protein LOC117318526 n=1 Tax=Pecten maximus TaxID=6579 RepID=UPI001458DC94|nr:uncharacterized protein LOC117318526 [Pecten maximus]